MQGFGAFFIKEVNEFFRTWRGRIIAILILVLALTSPLLAYFTPQIISSFASELMGMVPEPTYVDAYMQWSKNVSQLVLFAIIIVAGGMIASEISQGTAAMMLSKPLSRPAFVLSKFISHVLLTAVVLAVGALLCEGTTRLIFGGGDIVMLLKITAVLALVLSLFVAVGLLLSSLMGSLPAAGLGVAFYFILSILSLWKPATEYSPVGLLGAPDALAANMQVPLVWPIVTTGVAIVLLVSLSIVLFQQREA